MIYKPPPSFPGEFRQHQGYRYFLPALMQEAKGLSIPFSLQKQLEDSSMALGQFTTFFEKIPAPDLFIQAYSHKEADLSSRIEGTKTQIEDAFMAQEDVVPEKRDDWAEVNAYIQAQKYAFDSDLPLSNRLMRESHKRLLDQVRGRGKRPGKFRRGQNWIGGSRLENARFVPPHPDLVNHLMGDLEKFMQDADDHIPHLIKAGLIHSQFETIHPFSDGNGRMGRLLIILYLLDRRVITRPILYLSKFFEQHRSIYYDRLDGARQSDQGVLEWLSFFLDAVEKTAQDGLQTTEKIVALQSKYREEVLPQVLGRQTKKGLALLDLLFQRVAVSAKEIQTELGFSPQISHALLKHFVQVGLLEEVTKRKRNRLFIFKAYIQLLAGE